jgi:hypothetical protein
MMPGYIEYSTEFGLSPRINKRAKMRTIINTHWQKQNAKNRRAVSGSPNGFSVERALLTQSKTGAGAEKAGSN